MYKQKNSNKTSTLCIKFNICKNARKMDINILQSTVNVVLTNTTEKRNRQDSLHACRLHACRLHAIYTDCVTTATDELNICAILEYHSIHSLNI